MEKLEYLSNFDVVCQRLGSMSGFDDINTETIMGSGLTIEGVIEKRKELMIKGQEKYGSVYMNYFKVNRMNPLEDTVLRVRKYDETHDLDYLISAINYLMLAYWKCTKQAVDLKEPEMWASMVKDDVAFEVFDSGAIRTYINFFTTDKEIGYIIVAALRILHEILFPTYFDASCKGATESVETAGFSYKELQQMKSKERDS